MFALVRSFDANRVTVIRALAVALVLLSQCGISSLATAADDYPTKPVRLIVAYPPGGGVDIVGRLIATKLSERLGKQVVVENFGGAGGVIGTEVAARAAPDGYTILLASGGHTIQPALQKLPYDLMKSFTPVARIATGTTSLVVNANSPAKTLAEFIALAKQSPGKIVFASAGSGSPQHMAAELLRMKANVNYKIVQYKGGGPAITDLLGGHSDAYFTVVVLTMPHIKSGKLRILATGGEKRSKALPDVPTVAELGFPGFLYSQWYGIVAPTGTPAPIVDRLAKELQAITQMADVQTYFENEGGEIDFAAGSSFAQFLQQELTTWEGVVKAADIKLEQ